MIRLLFRPTASLVIGVANVSRLFGPVEGTVLACPSPRVEGQQASVLELDDVTDLAGVTDALGCNCRRSIAPSGCHSQEQQDCSWQGPVRIVV